LPSVANKILGSSSTTTIGLSSAANAIDIVNFYFDGTNYFWNVGQGYGTAATSSATNIAGGAAGSIPYQTAAGATSLLPIGSNGQILTLASGLPSWAAAPVTGVTSASSPLTISSNAISLGTVPVSSGGTGATTLTSGSLLKGNGTSAISAASAGTDYSAGTSALGTGILKSTTSTGVLTIATASDFPTLNQNTTGSAASVSGTVAVANGGTGLTSTPANGQIDIGNGTGFTRATLTAGTAITITNTAGAITIAAAIRPTTDEFTATAGQTAFTLSQTPLTNTTTSPVKPNVWMFINGVRTKNSAYAVSGTGVTYTASSNNNYTLVAGDRIQFDYAY
jgi:hypothetical protein